MRISKKTRPVLHDYTLYDRELKTVTQHSYLGVTLSDDMKWNEHISKAVKKANSTLGFIKRNLYPCAEATKHKAYIALVRPHLEYASSVWDPYR